MSEIDPRSIYSMTVKELRRFAIDNGMSLPYLAELKKAEIIKGLEAEFNRQKTVKDKTNKELE